MDPGERTTGTRDEHYNLIAVLYHALHGAENCEIYAMDAEAAGRDELAAFFREAQDAQTQLAERAKGLLGIGVAAPEAGGVTPSTISGGIPPDTVPLGEDVTPEGTVPPVAPRTGEGQLSPGEPPLSADVPSDAAREAPPPGEERPERRGMAPSTDAPREAPPPGEERPERRTP